MDPHRLPRHVVPSRYDVRLEPDLDTLTFEGEETIALTVVEPTSEIVLNAAELAIREAAVTDARGLPAECWLIYLDEEKAERVI